MNNIANATPKLTAKSPPPARAVRALCAAVSLMTLMSWSACQSPRVIAADQVALRVEAGRPFNAPCDGWFLSDALYQRTRRAVADRILELQP
jgi:hypothetical protein